VTLTPGRFSPNSSVTVPLIVILGRALKLLDKSDSSIKSFFDEKVCFKYNFSCPFSKAARILLTLTIKIKIVEKKFFIHKNYFAPIVKMDLSFYTQYMVQKKTQYLPE
jgi:hypothetical protein